MGLNIGDRGEAGRGGGVRRGRGAVVATRKVHCVSEGTCFEKQVAALGLSLSLCASLTALPTLSLTIITQLAIHSCTTLPGLAAQIELPVDTTTGAGEVNCPASCSYTGRPSSLPACGTPLSRRIKTHVTPAALMVATWQRRGGHGQGSLGAMCLQLQCSVVQSCWAGGRGEDRDEPGDDECSGKGSGLGPGRIGRHEVPSHFRPPGWQRLMSQRDVMSARREATTWLADHWPWLAAPGRDLVTAGPGTPHDLRAA